MNIQAHDELYFNKGKIENIKFWNRFDKPNFKNTTVLDVGCGHGRMCIDIALEGANKVIGIDIDKHRIEFAKDNLKTNFPHLVEIIEFFELNLSGLNAYRNFNYIISKDTFEHIIDLPILLESMKDRLKPYGKIFVGFAPLYNSFYGDHMLTKALLPWFHLIIPESILLRRLNRNRKVKIQKIQDLGLNKYSLKDYIRIFNNSSMTLKSFKVNISDNPVLKAFNFLRKLPGLDEFFTHNVYCVFENN